jgi:hypothetical protein
MTERQQFERWVSSSAPYIRDISRYPDDVFKFPWAGEYRDGRVQLAWEAWQQGQAALRACAENREGVERASRPSLDLMPPGTLGTPGTLKPTDWEQIARGLMFASWWQAYPARRRAAKKQCWGKWQKLAWDDCVRAYHDVVIRQRGVTDDEWIRGYNPAPMVYINQARWEQDWADADQGRERDHGGHRVRDGGDVVARAIEANRRKLAGE